MSKKCNGFGSLDQSRADGNQIPQGNHTYLSPLVLPWGHWLPSALACDVGGLDSRIFRLDTFTLNHFEPLLDHPGVILSKVPRDMVNGSVMIG